LPCVGIAAFVLRYRLGEYTVTKDTPFANWIAHPIGAAIEYRGYVNPGSSPITHSFKPKCWRINPVRRRLTLSYG